MRRDSLVRPILRQGFRGPDAMSLAQAILRRTPSKMLGAIMLLRPTYLTQRAFFPVWHETKSLFKNYLPECRRNFQDETASFLILGCSVASGQCRHNKRQDYHNPPLGNVLNKSCLSPGQIHQPSCKVLQVKFISLLAKCHSRGTNPNRFTGKRKKRRLRTFSKTRN